MFNPIATYRIQFNKDFTFRNFDAIIPYLHTLGIKTIYASPIFEAVPGSMHGYDVVNHFNVNPELGTENELRALSQKLKSLGMAWVQDVVPNHMAFHHSNVWLMDVLEKGSMSVYASFFDVTWTNELFHGRLMVPFLNGTLEETIQKNELQIIYAQQRLLIKYFDQCYPLHPRSYKVLLSNLPERSDEVQQLIAQLQLLPQISDQITYAFSWHEFLIQFASQIKGNSKGYIEKCIADANENPDMLLAITEDQAYRLCSWKETNTRINFRRFFTVNALICLNMQSEKVFNSYHQKIKSWIDEGIFQGLRVDHVDGLFNPEEYLQRLRTLAGTNAYIVVEKILEPGETLPQRWPVQGTTGYDYLGLVNNLFTKNKTEKRFSEFYKALIDDNRSATEKIRNKKAKILYGHMGGELENLVHFFRGLNLIDPTELDHLEPNELRDAIAEFLIQCPVYRYYGNYFPLLHDERKAIKTIFKSCRKERPKLVNAIDLLEDVLLNRTKNNDEKYISNAAQFYQRCMQFTGPLMAKGVEDTLMYTFNRFVGHNEVGDSPTFFGLGVDDFHIAMQARQHDSPLALNASATHDTKRGEDVRARLNVLPDVGKEWIKQVKVWQQLNADLKVQGAPDANDEYFIYQTLIGTCPIEPENDYSQRLEEYLTKALREAKRFSDWAAPNEQYEDATLSFTKTLLDTSRPFWKSFDVFRKKVNDHGIINSLSQVLLKFTCPGVPDSYQGSASWDLSLVDPDNRRAVDYELREQWLTDLLKQDSDNIWTNLWQTREDSRIKLWLTHTLLKVRNDVSQMFHEGLYIPLRVKGKYKDNVIAFARRYEHTWYVTAIPLYTASLCDEQQVEINLLDWKDTEIILPQDAPFNWQNVLSGNTGKRHEGILIQEIFKAFPLALLRLEAKQRDRSAGVLLSITSLPSPYGIGDMGNEAKAFVDFLARSGQTYWQLLPLNPVSALSSYSPYSSYCSMAGNTLLISPDVLVRDGLISRAKLKHYKLSVDSQVDFNQLEAKKIKLLEEAWSRFQKQNSPASHSEFHDFIQTESSWLHDFALYMVIKEKHEQNCWYEWPLEFKQRDEETLATFSKQYETQILKVKWFQFLFSQQWKQLKSYCNTRGIKLFGDLPFYVDHDSVDVWANQSIFSLDDAGNMKGVAGVPPDYFNDDGQLWGMPVYHWSALKEDGYTWWIERVSKNLELFDVIRFDHFRAFANYWEVPAGEKTAVNGKWKEGSSVDFFHALKTALGKLPFIAEDLGEITPEVHALRDEFNLHGMKVLQYAFDDAMADSIFIPHNFTTRFVVYTGTHDNNTTRGWFKHDISKAEKKRIEAYTGHTVTEENVSEILIRLAYSSVAEIAIIPLQDLLNLDARARMNTPSSVGGNWGWRFKPDQLKKSHEEVLKNLTLTYRR